MTRYWTSQALLLTVLVFLQNSLAKADSIPQIVVKAKPAIVEIIAMDQSGNPMKTGTGFFITSDGYLLTNNHVIAGSSHLSARTSSGAVYFFESVVARSVDPDLALLKFAATDVPHLALGSSTETVEGQRVLVIGNPEGLQGTVSDGIISAFRGDRTNIQITAPVSPGSSGSPVLDESGQVIGMATLVYREGQNLNFAISSETIRTYLVSQGNSAEAQASPVLSATPLRVSDQQAVAAFNFLQDRLGKPHAKRVWYDPRTDSYSWIGPKFGKKMSMPRSQFEAEIWPDYVKANPIEQRQ